MSQVGAARGRFAVRSSNARRRGTFLHADHDLSARVALFEVPHRRRGVGLITVAAVAATAALLALAALPSRPASPPRR